MNAADNPTLISHWLRAQFDKQPFTPADYQAIADAIPTPHLHQFTPANPEDNPTAVRTRIATRLAQEHHDRTIFETSTIPLLGQALAGTAYAHDHEDDIKQAVFPDTVVTGGNLTALFELMCQGDVEAVFETISNTVPATAIRRPDSGNKEADMENRADNPYLVRYWLHTLDEEDWREECWEIAAAVSDTFLDNSKALYGAQDASPAHRRAQFAAWLATHQKEIIPLWDDHTSLEAVLGDDLAGTVYARSHEADIAGSFPAPRTLTGESTAMLRGLSLGDNNDYDDLRDELMNFLDS